MSSDKPKALLPAPKGVATISIDGTSIHTGIPVGYFGKTCTC